MDPVRNPFAPGAGTPPPELAGRSALLERVTISLRRIAIGKPTKSMIIVGLRGVGKTVLLSEIEDIAQDEDYFTLNVEAHEDKSLPELIIPGLRRILIKLSMLEQSKELAKRGLGILKGFTASLKVKLPGIEIGVKAERGTADSGDIESDLPELIVAIGKAAKAAERPIAILIDELQYLKEKEFSALIMAIHRVNQKVYPFTLIGAGLPQILGIAGNSKSYAERLFDFPFVGALNTEDARQAIVLPVEEEEEKIDTDAVNEIINLTKGYPYFLQQWAYETWNYAESSPITRRDVLDVSDIVLQELDQSFFKVRLDRCTRTEQKYMRALAELGPGAQKSSDIAALLGVKPTSVSPTRSNLIKKGMIYSPIHGDTEFTVPLFDAYMKRAIPEFISQL